MTIEFDGGDVYNFQRGYSDYARSAGLDPLSIAACVEAGLATVACTKSVLHYASAKHLCESIPMLLWCPECSVRHIDEGEFARRDHHTHACQECGHVWRPAIVATRGVRFLPGFKNETSEVAP